MNICKTFLSDDPTGIIDPTGHFGHFGNFYYFIILLRFFAINLHLAHVDESEI